VEWLEGFPQVAKKEWGEWLALADSVRPAEWGLREQVDPAMDLADRVPQAERSSFGNLE
jgi:hypothetical protein